MTKLAEEALIQELSRLRICAGDDGLERLLATFEPRSRPARSENASRLATATFCLVLLLTSTLHGSVADRLFGPGLLRAGELLLLELARGLNPIR